MPQHTHKTNKKAAFYACLVLAVMISLASAGQATEDSNSVQFTGAISYWPEVNVNIDLGKTVATNNLSLGFMLDWEWTYWRDRTTLQQMTSDAGFKLIRLFSHRIEPCTTWNDTTQTGSFDWSKTDTIITRIFQAGCQPLICIGFCDSSQTIIPPGMTLDSKTGLPFPDSFAAYCREWIKHFESINLPVKFYEVWNEPFFYFYKNWVYNGTKLGYFFTLFNRCYSEMHSENSSILVGNDASLYRKFLDYWKTNGGKLDFFSYHKYDCDGISMDDQTPLTRAETRYFVTDSIWYGINDARNLWGITLPAIATECNWAASSASGTDPRIQKVVGATWLALVLRSSILANVQYNSYYCFSSSESWELANKGSGGLGFGMINHDDNTPWYPYYVQKLIGTNLNVGDSIVDSSCSSSDVRSIAWIHEGRLKILLIAKTDEPRTISLEGVTGQMQISRIDDNVSYRDPSLQFEQINAFAGLVTQGYSVILLET